MSTLKYEPVEPLSDDRIREEIQSGEPARIPKALYSAVRFCEDSKWTQDQCLAFLKSPHISVRWTAATCLGDLAFFKKPIDAQAVSDALLGACDDLSIADPASYSLGLVNQFAMKKH